MKEFNHNYLAGLVIRSQQNDSDAFAELYAATYNKVYNYARHYLRDDFLAQDAVQEIYISALKNITKIQDPTLFIAWLNQICFHVCYDMAAKNSQGAASVDDEILEVVRDEHPDSNPESKYQKEDELSRLREAIASLPFNERQVITLRFLNNMKLEEVADAMEISRSSVKRYLASGKDALAKIMKE